MAKNRKNCQKIDKNGQENSEKSKKKNTECEQLRGKNAQKGTKIDRKNQLETDKKC